MDRPEVKARYRRRKDGWSVTAQWRDKRVVVAGNRSLESARREIVSELSELTGKPAQFVVVRDEFDLASATGAVKSAQQARLAAIEAQALAASKTAIAARELIGAGLSLRDAGYVLGISHARIQQIINSQEEAA